MSVPQSRRGCHSLDGVERYLCPQEHRLLTLLLLRSPLTFVHGTEIIEWLYPNPDDEPDGSKRLVYVLMRRLRDAGIPIDKLGSGHMNSPFSSIPLRGGYRIRACHRGRAATLLQSSQLQRYEHENRALARECRRTRPRPTH